MSRVARALGIQPGEGGLALAVTGLMLATSAGTAIGGAATDALFFARFDLGLLPLMYLALGIVTLVFALSLSVLLVRLDRVVLYTAVPLALAAVLVIERALIETGGAWVYPTIWLAMNVITILVGIISWGVASAVCDTRQAKRLFPLFNAGRIGGGVLGGLLTAIAVGALHAENLVLVWAATLVGAFVLARLVFAFRPVQATDEPGDRPSVVAEIGRGLAVVGRSDLLRLLAVALVLFSILYFTLALPFTRMVRDTYPDADALAAFLGIFNGATTVAALLVSLFVANRLYARIGVVNSILAFTAIYIAGFAALAVRPAFTTVVAFRFTQMTWLTGIADTAYQALFNPVPPERRDQIRAFMEGVPGQVGIAIAGLILLVGEGALAPWQLSLVGIAAGTATFALIWRTRAAYRVALAEALRAGRPQPFLVETDPLGVLAQDPAAVEEAVSGLGSSDAGLRRVSAAILERIARPEDAEALAARAADPDEAVRASVLRSLRRVAPESTGEIAARALSDPAPAVRASAAVTLSDRDVLERMLSDTDAEARAAALDALAGAAPGVRDLAKRVLDDPAPGIRRKAIALVGADERAVAQRALEDPDPRVRAAALEALRRSPDPTAREAIRSFALRERDAAVRDVSYVSADPGTDERRALMLDALRHRAAGHARAAIAAALALVGRGPDDLVVEALERDDSAQRASALELIESAGEAQIVRPLLPLWEPAGRTSNDDELIQHGLADGDPFIRDLAEQIRDGGVPMQTLTTLSQMDRILFLRKVAIFKELSPADLKQIASLATEHLFTDGAVIAREGERGDRMYVIVTGSVIVRSGQRQVVTRDAGEVVGELALLTGEPRGATLVSSGETRCLCIGRRELDAIITDRPRVAVEIIRVLGARLLELTRRPA